MQNRSAIWVFTILLGLACLYQISFTYFTSNVESEADASAANSLKLYNDSIQAEGEDPLSASESSDKLNDFRAQYLTIKETEAVYPILGYTYQECKDRELVFGLDLKGGMNVVLEVSIQDLVKNFAANKRENTTFKKVIEASIAAQTESDDDFITIFAEKWEELAADYPMAKVFNNRDYREKFNAKATNDEIVAILRSEAQEAINSTERILRARIDKFGVSQPNIQKQGFSGRISVELPGVKDKKSVRGLLQGEANLEFWETYSNFEVGSTALGEADNYLRKKLYPEMDSIVQVANDTTLAAVDTAALDSGNVADPNDTTNQGTEDIASLLSNDSLNTTSGSAQSIVSAAENQAKIRPLTYYFQPAVFQDEATGQYQWQNGSTLGFAKVSDTLKVNKLLADPGVAAMFPEDLRLLWDAKASSTGYLGLQCIKVPDVTTGKALLDGEVIIDARQDYDQITGQVEVIMQMNGVGSEIWKNMTGDNVGKAVAVVLDDLVYSAPIVQGEIPTGNTSISLGNGDNVVKEAKALASILKAGSLPAPAKIVEEAVVGPSLGEANVSSGLYSFVVALIVVLLYMIFYYAKAGVISNVALIANIFFLIGALASLQASLTLPGIAGIVLTIGMSVDANVLIYERIREEIRAGKGMRLAIVDGYKRAYSAIVDANITTLLTGIVLFVFGSGPIKGFATTLIIGIFTSLFSAIFITRLIFMWQLEKKKSISFASKITENAFTKVNWGFITKRKIYYAISLVVIIGGIVSLSVRGLNFGVDFTGGRTYRASFANAADAETVKSALAAAFVTDDGRKISTDVKTIENVTQLKITTNYRIDDKGQEVDNEVEELVEATLKSVDASGEITESRKVASTISDDIKTSAGWAVGISLIIIFLYIVFRFRRWEFGLGALLAMVHDVLVVLALFSICYGILPFSMEIDQAFIAAILTVVGYSINDTVVVFDRIREYLGLHKRKDQKEVVNDALNSTLSRTFNTSLSTFFVLLMIFILGGEAIKGFTFALMIGVVVGTYSSLCIATPAAVDFAKSLAQGDDTAK